MNDEKANSQGQEDRPEAEDQGRDISVSEALEITEKNLGEADEKVRALKKELREADEKILKLEKQLVGKEKGIKGMQTHIRNLKKEVEKGTAKKMTIQQH